DLTGGGAELDLGPESGLDADAVVTGNPAGRVEDRLGLLRVVGGRRLVREEPGPWRDVRVGDLDLPAQEAGVDLVLVDRERDGLAHRRVGHRATGAAILDRRVLRARGRRPVRPE